MDKPLDGYSEEWLERKLKQFTVEIRAQGQCFMWQAKSGQSKLPPGIRRGKVSEFTKASRLRMLKFISWVDWRALGRGLFLTLTYPNEVLRKNKEELNRDRYLIHRKLEKHINGKVPCLWRVEWKPRQTGDKKDYVYPHWHMLLFRETFIDIEFIRDTWKHIIHSEQTPVTWITPMESDDHAAKYTAKYAAKVDCSLDNAAYHNSPCGGRQWGILRKELIPLCPEDKIILQQSQLLQEFKEKMINIILQYKRQNNDSFTVFGANAMFAAAWIFGMRVDDEPQSD